MTDKADYRSSCLELKIFVVLTLVLPTGGSPKNISAQLVEKWLRYWQWPTKLTIEAPSWCLKFFVVLTLLLPTGVLPKKNSAQMVEKWLKYWQWPTKLAIEAPSWSLKFFVVLTLLLPTGGLPKKISAQSVEKWLSYCQLKVCVVGGWVGGFQSIAWSQPQSGLAVTIIIMSLFSFVMRYKKLRYKEKCLLDAPIIHI